MAHDHVFPCLGASLPRSYVVLPVPCTMYALLRPMHRGLIAEALVLAAGTMSPGGTGAIREDARLNGGGERMWGMRMWDGRPAVMDQDSRARRGVCRSRRHRRAEFCGGWTAMRSTKVTKLTMRRIAKSLIRRTTQRGMHP